MNEERSAKLEARVESIAGGLGLSHLTFRFALAGLVADLHKSTPYKADNYLTWLRDKAEEGEGRAEQLADLADIIEALITGPNGPSAGGQLP